MRRSSIAISSIVGGLFVLSLNINNVYATSSDLSLESPGTQPVQDISKNRIHSYNLMALSPDEKVLYVTDSGANQVAVIDVTNSTSQPSEISRINVGNDPRGVAITPDAKKVYVSNHFDNTVSVIDADTNNVSKVIPVGSLPWGLDTSADGKKLFVANWGDNNNVTLEEKNSITVIDTSNDTVIHKIKLNASNVGGPWGVSHPPNVNETWIAVTMDYDNKLVLINTNTYQTKEINLGDLGVGAVKVKGMVVWSPWKVFITQDNRIIIASGTGPTFFPVIQVSCPNDPGDFSTCSIDTSGKLEFTGQDNINEPWSGYARGDKIYGVDMYNVAPEGTVQRGGSLLIWNASSLKLMQKYEHEQNPDKVGIAPLDVVTTSDGKIFVSNSGTHLLPSRGTAIQGIPFNYTDAAGNASITVSSFPTDSTDSISNLTSSETSFPVWPRPPAINVTGSIAVTQTILASWICTSYIYTWSH
jgi:YVTN family beta-propeller protein